MATTTMDMVAEVAVCVPGPRVAEGVEWCARQWSGRMGMVVTLWRPGGLPDAVLEAFRAGELSQGTIRMDTSADEAVVALGMSGRDVTADDLAGVAAAVLAGFDRAGDDEVRRTATATAAVLAGDAMPFERERYAAAWADPARLVHCRAMIAALVTAGMARPHVDEAALVLPGDFDPLEVAQ